MYTLYTGPKKHKNDDNDHGYDPFYLDAKGKKSHDLEMLKKIKGKILCNSLCFPNEVSFQVKGNS